MDFPEFSQQLIIRIVLFICALIGLVGTCLEWMSHGKHDEFYHTVIKLDLESIDNLFVQRSYKTITLFSILTRKYTLNAYILSYVLFLSSLIANSKKCIALWLTISAIRSFILSSVITLARLLLAAYTDKISFIILEFTLPSTFDTCVSTIFWYATWTYYKMPTIEDDADLDSTASVDTDAHSLNSAELSAQKKITSSSSEDLGSIHSDDNEFSEAVRLKPIFGLPLSEEIIDWVLNEVISLENQHRDEIGEDEDNNFPPSAFSTIAERAAKFLQMTPQEIFDARKTKLRKSNPLKRMSSNALPRLMPILKKGSFISLLETRSEKELKSVEMMKLEKNASHIRLNDLPLTLEALFGIFSKYHYYKPVVEDPSTSPTNDAKSLTRTMNYMPNITPHLTQNNTTTRYL